MCIVLKYSRVSIVVHLTRSKDAECYGRHIALYCCLLRKVVPYDKGKIKIIHRWLKTIRHASLNNNRQVFFFSHDATALSLKRIKKKKKRFALQVFRSTFILFFFSYCKATVVYNVIIVVGLIAPLCVCVCVRA